MILLTGKQTEENPITTKATPSAQPEVKEKAKAIDGFDAAAEFRERHNRALSPEAREDNRRKLWEQNFPYKPTFDPVVTVTADMISDEPESMKAINNHFYLRAFFESDLRFSPQFEQLYRIMEEYDRTDNTTALAWTFEALREYHKARRENPDEVIMQPDGSPAWRRTDNGERVPCTWGYYAEIFKESIRTEVDGRSQWPHKEPMPEGQADAIVERLMNEIPGMADLDGYLVADSGAHSPDTRQTLKVGDPLLVPYEGYQTGYDAWNDERSRQIVRGRGNRKRWKNLPTGILADGTLVNASNELIKASTGSLGSFVNFGKPFALQETEDGHVRLSPEAMSILDEEFGKSCSYG